MEFKRTRREAMKMIVSAVLALGVLAGTASLSSAADFDTQKFWQQQERSHY
jgi:hypothetical protein